MPCSNESLQGSSARKIHQLGFGRTATSVLACKPDMAASPGMRPRVADALGFRTMAPQDVRSSTQETGVVVFQNTFIITAALAQLIFTQQDKHVFLGVVPEITGRRRIMEAGQAERGFM